MSCKQSIVMEKSGSRDTFGRERVSADAQDRAEDVGVLSKVMKGSA